MLPTASRPEDKFTGKVTLWDLAQRENDGEKKYNFHFGDCVYSNEKSRYNLTSVGSVLFFEIALLTSAIPTLVV